MGTSFITNRNIGLGLNIVSTYNNYLNGKKQAEAQADQIIAQGKNAIKQMNYTLANYEQERKNAFESATAQLTNIRMQSRGLIAGVSNAVGELQGDSKTGKLLQRGVKADGLRAMTQTRENYIRKSDEIDQNKERVLLSTKDFLSSLQTPTIPNIFGGVLSQAGNLLNAYNNYRNIESTRQERIGDGAKDTNPKTWEQYYSETFHMPKSAFGNNSDNWSTYKTRFTRFNAQDTGVLQVLSNNPNDINYGERPNNFNAYGLPFMNDYFKTLDTTGSGGFTKY